MDRNKRIVAAVQLGDYLKTQLDLINRGLNSELDEVIHRAKAHNGWFDQVNVEKALRELANWLTTQSLTEWLNSYTFNPNSESKRVGVIMAGNIPLVGVHDYLCVVFSGHNLVAKLSSKDQVLLRFIHDKFCEYDSSLSNQVSFTEGRLDSLGAVIATGSNNSAKYFEYYFGKIPNIIRKNRTSVAVMEGDESNEELAALTKDIFTYFGLGCRNVTKVYFPKGFDRSWFYGGIVNSNAVMENHKYQNNYDYHKSVFLLNQDEIWDNNFLLLKEDSSLSSPVGMLFYEEYDDLNTLKQQLNTLENDLQVIVGRKFTPFGTAQSPNLKQYADNVDVMQFLINL